MAEARQAKRFATLGHLFEAFIEAGVPAMLILTTLLYTTQLSDYTVGKRVTIHVVCAVLAAAWLGRAALLGRLQLVRTALYWPILAFLLVSLLSLAFSHNRYEGAEVLLLQIWYFLLAVLALHHFRNTATAAGILWTVVGCGAIVSFLGILQHNEFHPLPRPERYTNDAISTLGNLNFVAHYLELVIPLIAAMLTVRRHWWERAFLLTALGLTGLHMILARSRAGWLALAIGLGFWSWTRWRGQGKGAAVGIGLVVVLLLGPSLQFLGQNIYVSTEKTLYSTVLGLAERTWLRMSTAVDLDNFSVAQRLLVWDDTLGLIADKPLLGVGPGNYAYFVAAYRSEEGHRNWHELMGKSTDVAYHAHNEYLEFAAETGLLGLAAMLWLLFVLLRVGWQNLMTGQGSEASAIIAGCMGGVIASLLHGLFSFNLQDPTAASHFWLLGGLMVALSASEGNRLKAVQLKRWWGRWGIGLGALVLLSLGIVVGWCIFRSDLFYLAGLRAYRDGQPAAAPFDGAIRWRSHDFRPHHMLGLVWRDRGDDLLAQRALERSLTLHPNNVPALRLLAEVLFRQGKTDQALPLAAKAVELDPLRGKNYVWLARVSGGAGRSQEAITAWEKVLELEGETGEALAGLGMEYAYVGRWEAAIAHLERADRLQPDQPHLVGNLGSLYIRTENFARAEKLLRWVVEAQPDEPKWRASLADLLSRTDRLQEAIHQVVIARRLAPKDKGIEQLEQQLRLSVKKKNSLKKKNSAKKNSVNKEQL